MNTIIIEDEYIAAKALEELIGEVAPELNIVTTLQSIDESVEWLTSHPSPDLIFMDIHLADGSSFAIFDEVTITCPIIFTTAYDEYALKAFEVNSVDYLLKPINKSNLERAIGKFKRLSHVEEAAVDHAQLINKLMASMKEKTGAYKSSLLVAVKDKLIPIATKDIAYVYIENKIVKAVTFDEKSHVLDLNMEELYQQLDPNSFFRANRQYIIARSAVKEMVNWFGNRLALNLTVTTADRIYISRTNAREFKNWITN
ncbi:LytTR family DNA-binding domain-containing protein [Odoribacter sp. OttesenSCG-928-J03]|nr:LytTR family DNA-binding domain-containing protein [Odoribacter sp. OttesenSCG-928-J03]MDL2283492.1 LytTR family DNA-binding domain-containing protein [Odoribacter sp. OttesenSCG-928-G04]